MGFVVVLDADVLVPAGVRDVLLSCADEGVFRPIWQDEILAETRRNVLKVQRKRMVDDFDEAVAAANVDRMIATMNSAFPDACLARRSWQPKLAAMTNDPKDRHVMAAAVAARATHIVTGNVRHFPVHSRQPAGLVVHTADDFLVALLGDQQQQSLVLEAVRAMARRYRNPPYTASELAESFQQGDRLTQFGRRLVDMI